jgi:beta-lactamase regulating signal transducer with metallopeptidase domain
MGQNLEKVISTINFSSPEIVFSQNTFNKNISQSIDTEQTSSINLSNILLIIYFFGVLIFLFRFLKNIYTILHEIKLSEKINYSAYRIVLSESQKNPHCFFNTIFLNKQDYLKEIIDKDLLSHELGHIREWHSLDILFIEIIRSLYWFNPIILLYRKAIIVNHEYLADNSVIRNHYDIKSYSEKLLSFIVCSNNIPLTSGFSHSLTMRRLHMMTKTNSKSFLTRIKIVITLSLILFYFILLSCNYSNKQSETFTLPSTVTISSGHDPNWKLSKKDSIIIDSIESGTTVYPTKYENELWRWNAILKKHQIDLKNFNYKSTFERKLYDIISDRFIELGTMDTVENQKITLKDAIIISKADSNEEYWILTGKTIYHDYETWIYEVINGSMQKFSITSNIKKPLSESFIKSVTHDLKRHRMHGS